jgi:nitroimidazol reductase NimA-like FMN-containing flavoprotein (pyridoxamine 5'-phosphate oxidase superfamily)
MSENVTMSQNRTTPARMPERVSSGGRHDLARLVRDARVAHVGFVEVGRPVVMPIAVAADGEDLLLHGSTGSWWLRRIATGIPVTVSLAVVDGLVFARSAFESSMRYRSAVLFGSCAPVGEDEKARALDVVTDGLLPGRAEELRPHRRKELAATMLLRLRIDEWTLKTGTQWPDDDEEDRAGDAWAGVVPIVSSYGEAIPAPDLRPGIRTAASVERLGSAQR